VNKLLVLGLVLFATIIGAVGSLYLKFGSKKISFKIIEQLKNWELILGIFLFVISSAFYVPALKMANLSLVYPTTSLSYVWVTLLSKKFLKENINKYKWFGIALIILGVFLIAR